MTNQSTTNQSPHPSLEVSAAISQAIYRLICKTSHQRPELIVSKYRSTPWTLVQSTFLSKIQQTLNNLSAPIAIEKKIDKILRIFLEPNFFLLPQAANIQAKIEKIAHRDMVSLVNIPKIADQEQDLCTDPIGRVGIAHLAPSIVNQTIFCVSPEEINQEINQENLFRAENNSTSKNHNGTTNTQVANTQFTNTQFTNTQFTNTQGIAILLLDVENLQLDAATEKFLAEICQYPIQIKIAFANWRHMGKQDLEFHQRGYELIHVPAGKDSADVKLATVGSSIFVHYPTAKEVLVCSSDAVLTHLCTTLQTHGLGVYLVRKKGEILTALDMKTGSTHTRMLRISSEINSCNQLIIQLQKIISAEQQLTGKRWIQLARISYLFRSKYHLTISQVVSMYLPDKKARDIFLGNPNIFVIHRPTKEKNLYVSLFDNLNLASGNSQNIIKTPNSPTPQLFQKEIVSNNGANTMNNGVEILEEFLSNSHASITENGSGKSNSISSIPFTSQGDLEMALIKLIKENIHNTKCEFVYVGVLGNQFSRRYGWKITDVVKILKLANTFSLFLESSPLFHLNRNDNQVTVSLANNNVS